MKESVVRETAVSRVTKDTATFVKDDEKFIEFITNELTKEISERIIRALEESDGIVVKKPVLKVSEYPFYVEYRKTVDWEPLVRCKDCMWFNTSACAIRIVDESDKPKENDFCSFGERREDG